MKLILLTLYIFVGLGMINQDVEIEKVDVVSSSEFFLEGESIGEFVVCGDEANQEGDAGLLSNPCSGLTHCGGANNQFCGSVDYSNPDGSGHTVVCRGYDGPPIDPIVN